MKRRIRTRTILIAVAACALGVTQLGACRSPVPNRDPTGELFPPVLGKSLEEVELRLPDAIADGPAILLAGYVQKAQFDADRWLYGLLQAQIPVRIYEIPTIPGLFPRLLAGTIDSGMRSGIPSEDWSSVVTVYGSDAKKIVELTGNEEPRNIRVLLLDAGGRVHWFHDRGFSAGKLLELAERATALASNQERP